MGSQVLTSTKAASHFISPGYFPRHWKYFNMNQSDLITLEDFDLDLLSEPQTHPESLEYSFLTSASQFNYRRRCSLSSLWLDDDLITAQYNRTPSPTLSQQSFIPGSNQIQQHFVSDSDSIFNSPTLTSAVANATGFQGDAQPLDIPCLDKTLATTPTNWTPSPNLLQEDIFNSQLSNSSADSTGTETQENIQVSILLSEDGIVYNVVASPEAIKPTAQPVDQNEEKSLVDPVETAVQKCRRKQKENEVALKEKDLTLSAE